MKQARAAATRRQFVAATAASLAPSRARAATAEADLISAMDAVRKARPTASADPARPIYHFHPPANWNNDPNGGQSLGSSTHRIMNALISTIFPVMAASSGAAPFVFFAFMMAVQFAVVLVFYPETKGFSLEEMELHLAG